jgi:nitrite reductase/ring-hydroxylating ferredoxin subunit
MHTKQFPYRSYVIAGPVPTGSVETALFWDTADPYHYVRLAREADHDLLIVGGEDHKTGQEDDGFDRNERLVSWTRERFPMMRQITYRWSGQVIETMDAVGFIGRNPGDENVWIVTGDSGMGMTHGTIASILLSDLIAGRENRWSRLYEPSRKSLRAVGELARENLNMAAQYASWVTGGDVKDESEIPRSSGAVMREGLKKVAVYRDETGRLHRCSATCPHLGAIVSWNSEERTWDCPAHGSRFDAMGHVLNGPANTDLARTDEPERGKPKDEPTPEEVLAKSRTRSPGAQEKI